MVSRLRKTLAVQQRARAFEHTNRVANDAAEEDRRLRQEKSERLRMLRLAAAGHGEQIGARLRDARIAKGYSLEDLAIATGLPEAEIAAVENGKTADDHHVERIGHALG